MYKYAISGGDTATLECELHAVPPAIVTWLKDNVPLTQSENVQFVTKGNMNYLVIKNTKNEDSGLYLCKATNSHGTASCSTQLNVQGLLFCLVYFGWCCVL